MSAFGKPLVGESAFFGVVGVANLVWAAVLALVLEGQRSNWLAIGLAGAASLALGLVFLFLGLKGDRPLPLLAELRIFVLLEVFFLIVIPVYWVLSHEVTGSVALVLTFGLSTMLLAYLLITALKHDQRPEDRLQADIVEGAGELGFFAPRSSWPIVCAGLLAITLLGPVFGWWLTIMGMGLGLWAICGWVYEFYRGDYAH